EYYFNDRNTLLASFSYNLGDSQNNTDMIYRDYKANREINSVRLRDELELEDEVEKGINLNYESKFNEEGNHKLTLIFNYEDEEETEDSRYINDYIEGAGIDGVDTSLNKEQQENILIQADYVLPFNENEGQFEAGYKSEINAIRSNSQVIRSGELQEGLTNNLEYNEGIHAFYTQYGNKFGKFTFLAGLRMEISDISIKSI